MVRHPVPVTETVFQELFRLPRYNESECKHTIDFRVQAGGAWIMAKIMIVDDAAFMRTMLKDILLQGGHEVVAEASNGEEAIEHYRMFRPELVTMDITMPIMEGVQALREIRRIDPQARVIMCSAVGQRQMIVEAIQSGAKDFIVKPFQSFRVLDAVQRAMQA
jgi:two-component system chemotaxis response regulator CheY